MGAAYTKPAEVESVAFPAFKESSDAPSLKDKNIAITGCTSGTGLVAAKFVAEKGAKTVFLLNRPSERAEKALAAVNEVAPRGTRVVHVDCDLMSFDSVRAAAVKVLPDAIKSGGLDVLCNNLCGNQNFTARCAESLRRPPRHRRDACSIPDTLVDFRTGNNAGVMALADKATTDGYDVQMQTNHLSHFLLSKELYPALKLAATTRGEARIVNHSSGARFMPGTKLTTANCEKYLGKNGGDLGGDGSSMILGGARWVRYAYTKLSNAVFTLALSEKLEGTGIKALCATPGLAATNLQVTTASDGAFGVMDNWIMRMAQSGEDGAVPLLYCCVAPGVENGDLIEPEHNGKLMPRMYGAAKKWEWGSEASTTADKEAFWAASEAAAGKWDF